MKSLIAVLCAGLAAAAVAGGQRDAPQKAQASGSARLLGRVIAADTGTPVRGARVTLIDGDLSKWIAVTDEEGRFDLRELPAAIFMLRIDKAGFVEAAPPNIDLKEKPVVDRGDIKLVRGGVIAGRVVDMYGEPVVDATVSAARVIYRGSPGNRALMGMQSGRTNDLGDFRIYGLQTGSYFVYAGFSTMQVSSSGEGGEPRVRYAGAASAPVLTFYPGTVRAADAQVVKVSAGEQVFADVRLISQALSSLSGRVVNSKGEPATGAMVMVMPPPEESLLMFKASGVQVDAQGGFTVNNLSPGDYQVEVVDRSFFEAMGRTGSMAAAARELSETASLTVTVAGDIRNLVIQTSVGFELRGRITVDGEPLPASWVPKLVVSARGSAFPAKPAEVAPDGTFVLRGLMGHRSIWVSGLPSGSTVDQVVARGLDITDDGITVDNNVSGAEVAVTTKPTVVTGAVTDAKGGPTSSDVILYADDAKLWMKSSGRYVKTVRSDPERGFQLVGLPPGRYLAVAIEELDENEWANPDNLEQLRTTATAFTLAKGGAMKLALIRR